MAFVADAFLFAVCTGVYGYARTHRAWTENQDAHDIVAAMCCDITWPRVVTGIVT